jgi:cell wall-associated NlpC family hydrolase
LVVLTLLASAGAVVAAPASDAVAAKARASAAVLKKGARGTAVVILQRRLGLYADGVFGRRTKRAVQRFQRRHGLLADGEVGPATAAALGITLPASRRSSRRAKRPPAVRMTPDAIALMQSLIGATADGEMGPATRRALKRYEAAKGLPADGRPDAQVLAVLGVDPNRAPAPAPAAAPAGQGAAGALAAARSVLGVPYASAGTTPAGFDCSGLTQWAFKQAGVRLPRTSYAQFGVGTAIDRSQIAPGDLVFFSTNGGGASHVGIATSPTTVISATTRGVREHAIGDDYWGSHYVGARRV